MWKIFQDRSQAGRLLAERLTAFADRRDVVVLGLPRGGVPVAFEVAQRLHAPLDVMVVRKLPVPGQNEFALGALASGGVRVLNRQTMEWLHINQAVADEVSGHELIELQRREALYRGHMPALGLAGKVVLLVDDGIATSATMRAAAQAARAQRPRRLIVAVPTMNPAVHDAVAREADEVVTLVSPQKFQAVGQCYENFTQTSDADVVHLLHRARDASSATSARPSAAA